jgi:hypothetical protein
MREGSFRLQGSENKEEGVLSTVDRKGTNTQRDVKKGMVNALRSIQPTS